jgi:3-deoxy-D-manno-octulosonic-acid transferase
MFGLFNLYSLLFYLALPFLILRLYYRSLKNSSYRKRIKERFALGLPKISSSIWIHAVSVGESLAAISLVKKIKERNPGKNIVITTTTPTGSLCVQKKLGNEVLHFYTPYDCTVIVKRFLRFLNPEMLIVMETELWPNIFFQCHKKNIPIFLVNARLTERSVKRYLSFSKSITWILSMVKTIFAQSEKDAARYLTIGAKKEQIITAGNLKFDFEIPVQVFPKAKALRDLWGEKRRVLICGSTHPGEEKIILSTYSELKKQFPDLLLVLAPRHPERFNQVAEACKSEGYQVSRYSQDSQYLTHGDIILVDVIGELINFYQAGDIIFVGGSLVNAGGHNILEPAALAKPIISGSHFENSAEIIELFIKKEAILIANNGDEFKNLVIKLLSDNDFSAKVARCAKETFEANRNVAGRILGIIFQ